eukprot:1180352-Prorocentrum_minimum.AAC.6
MRNRPSDFSFEIRKRGAVSESKRFKPNATARRDAARLTTDHLPTVPGATLRDCATRDSVVPARHSGEGRHAAAVGDAHVRVGEPVHPLAEGDGDGEGRVRGGQPAGGVRGGGPVRGGEGGGGLDRVVHPRQQVALRVHVDARVVRHRARVHLQIGPIALGSVTF